MKRDFSNTPTKAMMRMLCRYFDRYQVYSWPRERMIKELEKLQKEKKL